MATSESREDRYARQRRALPADQARWADEDGVSSLDMRDMLRYNGVPGVTEMDRSAQAAALARLIDTGELLVAGAQPRARAL